MVLNVSVCGAGGIVEALLDTLLETLSISVYCIRVQVKRLWIYRDLFYSVKIKINQNKPIKFYLNWMNGRD